MTAITEDVHLISDPMTCVRRKMRFRLIHTPKQLLDFTSYVIIAAMFCVASRHHARRMLRTRLHVLQALFLT